MSSITLPDARDPEAPRILIVRLSALGDIVFATSLLASLRLRWPRAWIGWLAQPGFAGILEADPRLDALIRVPAESLRAPRALLALRGKLRAQRFDWVIDAQGLFKSRVLAALAGGHRVGFDSKEPGRALLHQVIAKNGDVRDIASEYRFLATALTGLPAGVPSLPLTPAQQTRIADRAGGLGIEPGFVACCPFTTRPQKHWFESSWAQLIDRLGTAGLGPCVLFGGPGDREAAARIVAAAQTPVINFVGETRLPELPAWLARARLVIGVDTGLTHIGIATGRPTIALFGSTRPYTQLGDPASEDRLRVLYEDLPCAPCRRRPTCDGRFDCMRALSPERVASTAQGLAALTSGG